MYQHFVKTYYRLFGINFLICLCYDNNLFSILTRFIWWKRCIWKRAMKLRGNCGKKHLFLHKHASFLKVFSQKDVFPELLFTFWEKILLGNCRLGNNTSGKVSLWETVLLGNWPSGKLPTGKQAFWETVLLGNFLLGKILWETVFWELTSGKLPNTD